jgi:hypothetical protein
MCIRSKNKDREKIDRAIVALVALALLPSEPPRLGQILLTLRLPYAQIAGFQVHIAQPLRQGGIGDGCDEVEIGGTIVKLLGF